MEEARSNDGTPDRGQPLPRTAAHSRPQRTVARLRAAVPQQPAKRRRLSDQVAATATVVTNAFAELSVGDALGPYRGFINVDHDFLFSDMIELLPRESVMLEILETVVPNEAVVARCAICARRDSSSRSTTSSGSMRPTTRS